MIACRVMSSGKSWAGAVIHDRWRLDTELGSGTTGAVYRGAGLVEARPVAIKLLHPDWLGHEEARRRFEREAKALTTLRHPNVIDVLEFGEWEGALYMVMELLEGRTLAAHLEAGPMRPSAAMALADQILAGLAFAHAHGVLHRDLKSENVFVAGDPNAGGTRAK